MKLQRNVSELLFHQSYRKFGWKATVITWSSNSGKYETKQVEAAFWALQWRISRKNNQLTTLGKTLSFWLKGTLNLGKCGWNKTKQYWRHHMTLLFALLRQKSLTQLAFVIKNDLVFLSIYFGSRAIIVAVFLKKGNWYTSKYFRGNNIIKVENLWTRMWHHKRYPGNLRNYLTLLY